ncbi:MAG: Gfo/Idh/MocA family oxidoreductase [Candidatus Riflebacteria bacterium]|nr:Gfo/Idh/MocA family oxidoreductase [Candidatus Riflebacteria bacterium]
MTHSFNGPPLSLAFIGGSIKSAVGYAHFAASRMDNRWKLVAGCFSRDSEINHATAAQWGVEPDRVYSNWSELLKQEQGRIDGVVILLPTPVHAEVSMAAINAGFGVICEKSLATSSEEAKAILELIKKKAGFLAVTFNYTGFPMVRELKQIIEAKKLGKIMQVLVEMPQESFNRQSPGRIGPQPQTWRTKDYKIPTISLDLGVHIHHLVDFLTGEKALEVMGDQAMLGEHVAVVDNIMCIARYTNDMRCQMWFSKTAIGYRNGLRIRVFGESGSAEWIQENPEELRLNFANGQRMLIDRASDLLLVARQPRYNRFKAGHPSGFIEAFANLYCDIADNLMLFKQGKITDQNYICNVKMAVEGLEFFETIGKSNTSNQWQKIGDIND